MGKASRRKPIDISLKRRPSADPRDAMIDEQRESLYLLGEMLKKQHGEIDLLLDQLGEVNLRVRFIMEMFKYEKASKVIGFDGRPVTAEVKSLHELYLHSREKFLAVLTKGPTDGAIAGTHDGAKGTGESEPPLDFGLDAGDTKDAGQRRLALVT